MLAVERPDYDTSVQGCPFRVTRVARSNSLPTLAALLLGFMQVGCQAPPPPVSFSSAVSRYEEGRYQQSLDQGKQLAASQSGTPSQQAALVAAMSAYKLSRLDVAREFALKASGCADSATAGGAMVLLGDIALAEHDPQHAVEWFDKAAGKLPPEDAAHARDCATRARSLIESVKRAQVAAIPDPEPSIEDAKPATVPAPTIKGTPKTPAQAATGQRSFTIRAGSYTSREAANKRVRALASDTKRANAPNARVDEIHTPKGEELFAVRIGTWPTRGEAEKVMAQLGRHDLMVGAVEKGN